jgi:F-type H+-transporting ATPase subunit a
MSKEPLVTILGRKVGLPPSIYEANQHVITAGLVVIVLIVLSIVVWYRLKDIDKRLIPSGRFSLVSLFETVVEVIVDFMEGILGKDARRYLPLIGTLFIYIFCCNLMGDVPGFSPPTANINTNLACALCVFVYYNYVGIRKRGLFKYIKHMAGPVLWLAPLMLTIELVSHLVRPISLSVRLFGNMTGDHMVLELFSDLTPLVIPIIFLGLTIFVAFIQAFVFSLLSILYIALATQVEGET